MYEDIRKCLGQSWENYRTELRTALQSGNPLLCRINEYMLAHPGKQLRPLLSLLTAKALRGDCGNCVCRVAGAAELLHTATLMHDDVADNSSLRRGLPTVMAMYGSTQSVLVGDFWLSRAIGLIVDHPDRRVLKCYSKCLEDLAEGEMLQLEKSETLDTTEEDYRRIIYCKTASLFETAVLSAAYSVNATEEEVSSCRQFAYHVGMAFQIMDDIFDYCPEIMTGKPSGQDILEKKLTLPVLGFLKNAENSVRRNFLAAVRKQAGNLPEMATEMTRQYGGVEYARICLQKEVDLATEALSALPDSEARRNLVSIANQLSSRKY